MYEVIDSENSPYLKALKLLFHRTPFGNQPVKGPKTLLKSGQQHFYTNIPLISNKLSCASCLLVIS